MKNDGWLGRNYRKGTLGNRINAILAACGRSLRKLLNWLARHPALIFCAFFEALVAAAWATFPRSSYFQSPTRFCYSLHLSPPKRNSPPNEFFRDDLLAQATGSTCFRAETEGADTVPGSYRRVLCFGDLRRRSLAFFGSFGVFSVVSL